MKKKILIAIIFLLIFLDFYLFSNYIYTRYKNKTFLEKYDINMAKDIQNSDFQINKIVLYSSASGKNKNTNFQNKDWLLDIFEYTDIAIYFAIPENLTTKNTIQSLNISNINYNMNSDRYSPEIFYLDANQFGTDNISSNYKIEDNLEYTVLNYNNKDNSIQYNTPVFFSDLSNPITLKFTNMLLKNYSIPNTEKLVFDGSLLTKTPLKLKNLQGSFSFDINISNFEKEQYSANVNIKIPLTTNSDSIYSGHLLETQDVNLKFLKQ